MRKAVRVESNRKAILLVGPAGILRLLTLAVSETKEEKKKTKKQNNVNRLCTRTQYQ